MLDCAGARYPAGTLDDFAYLSLSSHSQMASTASLLHSHTCVEWHIASYSRKTKQPVFRSRFRRAHASRRCRVVALPSRCDPLSWPYLQSMGKSLTFRGAVFEAQDILRHHRCKDPICDTNLWKTRHELDLARLRILQLERLLEANGLKPPTKRINVPHAGVLMSRDMTRSHVFTNEFGARLYRPDSREVQEMETVL